MRARVATMWTPPARMALAGAAGLVAWMGGTAGKAPLVPAIVIGALVFALAAVRYPEVHLILYYITGKIGFEERLALGWGWSANQVLQVLFGLSFLIAVAQRRPGRQFPRVGLGVLTMLTGALALGLMYSQNFDYGASKVLAYVLLVLPGVLYLGLVMRDPGRVQRFLFFFGLVGTGMMLLGLRNIGSLEEGHRLAVFGGGANVYARMVGTAFLLVITFGVVLRRSGHPMIATALLLVLVPAFLVTMYYAGSKGPLLGFVASFMLFALLNGFLRRVLVVGALIVAVFVGARNQSRVFNDTVELVTASRLFLNPTDEVSYGSYGSRMEFYAYSGELLRTRFLTGMGSGGWGVERKFFEERAYPHNLFVETATELGLPMALLLAAYCAWLGLQSLRLLRTPMPAVDRVVGAGLVSVLFFWFVNVQISGDLIDNRNLWLFAILVEVSVRLYRHRDPGGIVA